MKYESAQRSETEARRIKREETGERWPHSAHSLQFLAFLLGYIMHPLDYPERDY